MQYSGMTFVQNFDENFPFGLKVIKRGMHYDEENRLKW
jgi:hypothetical protein